jgi:hypothetical protein
MSVKQSDLADLIALTINDLPDQYFEVMWDNQDYEFCRIYQNERMVVDGGNQIERKVMLDDSGHARYRRAYDVDNPTVEDVMETIKVGWCRLSTDYSWDDFEILQNKNSAKGFVNLLKTRRIDGLWSLADLIEERAWKTPTSATDDLYPYGVPYYLNLMGTTTTTDGFVGQTIVYQDGTTGTTCAGLSANTNSKWRNYAALYTNIDNAMLKTFRKAFLKTRFKAPININDPGQKRTGQKRIYTDFDNVCDLMDLVDAKDDNHTSAKREALGGLTVDDGGLVYINRLPVVPVPQLENFTQPGDTTEVAPIFCVDFKYFIPYVHDGYWMKETEPFTDRGQHTTFTIYLDGAHQNLCTNRRRAGFVLHKAW